MFLLMHTGQDLLLTKDPPQGIAPLCGELGNLEKQKAKCCGSAEAQFRAMAQGICEGLQIYRVLKEHKKSVELPLKLYCDSKAAISIACNSVQHDRTKYIEIDRHFIKEKLDARTTGFLFIPSNQQMTNILTKGLARIKFDQLISQLDMINIQAPT